MGLLGKTAWVTGHHSGKVSGWAPPRSRCVPPGEGCPYCYADVPIQAVTAARLRLQLGWAYGLLCMYHAVPDREDEEVEHDWGCGLSLDGR